MFNKDSKSFISSSKDTLNSLFEKYQNTRAVEIDEFDKDNTALIVIDMTNGFAKEGALSSPRVFDLIEPIAKVSKAFSELGIKKVIFNDCHSMDSPEFEAYPPHCMCDHEESENVTEIMETGGFYEIPKNSTNGFIEPEFQNWLKANDKIKNFLVVGDCTDICILQFATTLKTWFNRTDAKSRVIVPINLVNTYDFDIHNGDLMNLMALYFMEQNGVEIVKDIEFGRD